MFSFTARRNNSIPELSQRVYDNVARFLEHNAVLNLLRIRAKFRRQSWDFKQLQAENSWFKRVERSPYKNIVEGIVLLLNNRQRNDDWTGRVASSWCWLRRGCTFFWRWHFSGFISSVSMCEVANRNLFWNVDAIVIVCTSCLFCWFWLGELFSHSPHILVVVLFDCRRRWSNDTISKNLQEKIMFVLD